MPVLCSASMPQWDRGRWEGRVLTIVEQWNSGIGVPAGSSIGADVKGSARIGVAGLAGGKLVDGISRNKSKMGSTREVEDVEFMELDNV